MKSAKFRAALLDVIAESGAAAGNCTKAKANLLYNIAAKVRARCCQRRAAARCAAACCLRRPASLPCRRRWLRSLRCARC